MHLENTAAFGSRPGRGRSTIELRRVRRVAPREALVLGVAPPQLRLVRRLVARESFQDRAQSARLRVAGLRREDPVLAVRTIRGGAADDPDDSLMAPQTIRTIRAGAAASRNVLG